MVLDPQITDPERAATLKFRDAITTMGVKSEKARQFVVDRFSELSAAPFSPSWESEVTIFWKVVNTFKKQEGVFEEINAEKISELRSAASPILRNWHREGSSHPSELKDLAEDVERRRADFQDRTPHFRYSRAQEQQLVQFTRGVRERGFSLIEELAKDALTSPKSAQEYACILDFGDELGRPLGRELPESTKARISELYQAQRSVELAEFRQKLHRRNMK